MTVWIDRKGLELNTSGEIRFNCPRCQAPMSAAADTVSLDCWKCGTRLRRQTPEPVYEIPLAEVVGPPSKQEFSFNYRLASLLLLITIVAVLLALSVAAPGLGITIGILLLPPLIRTSLLVHRSKQMGRPLTMQKATTSFLLSFGVTIVISYAVMAVVTVVALASMVVYCFAALGQLNNPQGAQNVETFGIIALVFTIGIGLLVLFSFSFWVRARWQRDMERLKSPGG